MCANPEDPIFANPEGPCFSNPEGSQIVGSCFCQPGRVLFSPIRKGPSFTISGRSNFCNSKGS